MPKISLKSLFLRAIDRYNKFLEKRQLKAKLENESMLVAEESIKILKDFEELED